MNQTQPKRLHVALELVFVCGLLMAQIWFLPRTVIPLTVVVILGFIVASYRHCHKDLSWFEYVGLGKWEIKWGDWKSWWLQWLNRFRIGKLRIRKLEEFKMTLDWSQSQAVLVWTFVSLIGMTLLALLINPQFWQEPKLMDKMFERFAKYLLWGPTQQFLVQGYLTNRFEIVCKKRWLTAFMAGSLFALAHYPNPVLMPGTFILGVVGAYYFLKARNVFLIGWVHAVLATAIRYLIAYDLFDHPMRVGPGFWQ